MKKVISRFNTHSNRLIQAAYDDYIDVLSKYIKYLESTEIIMDYISECGGYNEKIKEAFDEFKDCESDYNTYFELGDTTEEEVRSVYSIMKFISDNNDDVPYMVLVSYGGYNSGSEQLEAFNQRVVYVLILHIEEYLKEIGIEMGLDDNTTFVVSGGQVNIANDNSTINAVQNNGIATNAEECAKLFEALRNEINTLGNSEDRTDASESVETIEKELKSEQPNESVLKTCFKFLKRLDPEGKITSICKKIAVTAAVANPVFEGIKSLFT